MNTSNDWREVTLGEVAEIAMGQSPTADTYNQENIGIPFYQGVVDFGDRFVTPRIYCSAPKKVIAAGHILLSVRAPVGRINFTREECAIGRGNAGLKMKNGQQNFLFYMLRYCAKGFEANSSGTVFASISKPDIENFRIKFPPLHEQKAIAEVLSSLDDKIDLLQRQNQTLAAVAQTLFRKWFIEDADELWAEVSLSDSMLSKLIPSGINKFAGEKTYLATANVQQEKIHNANTKITYDKRPSRANMQPVKYSVWFAKKEGVRKLLMFDDFSEENQKRMILSSGFSGLKTTAQSHYYVWCFILSQDFHNIKDGLVSGTVQPDINNDAIEKIKLPQPDGESLERFNGQVMPLFAKMQANTRQIASLQTLRDTLLPKLLSGKIKTVFEAP